MKKINKRDLVIFTIIFIITLIVFIPFLKGHYATDTYNIANVGYKEYAIKWSLNDGRIVMAILGLIAGQINIPIETYVFITLFLALFISNISVIKLTNIIKKYKPIDNVLNEIILITISYITIFNFMYLEDMYYVESIVMSASILLYMLAANVLVQKSKKYVIKSLVLVVLGVICYQGTIGMFGAFLILFTILKNKDNIKQIVIDLLKGACIAFLAVLLNIIFVKIIGNIFGMDQKRLGDVKNIFRNIYMIIVLLPNIMQTTCNLFPKNLFIIFLDIVTVMFIIYNIKNSKKDRNVIYNYIAIVIVILVASSATYILTLTSFYTGRLRNALGALIGIVFLFMFARTDLFKGNKMLKILAYITLISYALITIINYDIIMVEHNNINIVEKEEVSKIDEYVKKYEEENNIKVTRIVKIPADKKLRNKYFYSVHPIIYDAIKTSWASDGVINFYTNRNLITQKLNKEITEKYLKYSNEKLDYQCIDDILFINIYMY